ncbi:hypothetical protein CR513_07670, partial [Mucuna pruriens]
MNLVRSMLSKKEVPKALWLEAMKWIIPTLTVKGMTLENAWSGDKLLIEHFGVIDKAKGQNDESKGYKLYDPSSKKVLISRNFIFEEDK